MFSNTAGANAFNEEKRNAKSINRSMDNFFVADGFVVADNDGVNEDDAEATRALFHNKTLADDEAFELTSPTARAAEADHKRKMAAKEERNKVEERKVTFKDFSKDVPAFKPDKGTVDNDVDQVATTKQLVSRERSGTAPGECLCLCWMMKFLY